MIEIPPINTSKPVLIAGPTASGKSALALELARRHNGVIVNADALQVYACWRVLTARPGPEETALAPHFLYGHIDCDHKYSVGDWLRDVKEILSKQSPVLPIIIGGTGLYLTSLTKGLSDIPNVDAEIRDASAQMISQGGIGEMIARLAQDDPATYSKIDLKNPARVARAWEVLEATGRGLSFWQAETPRPVLALHEANAFVVNAPKENLTPRIEQRFLQMIENGALDECRKNLANWNPSLPSSRAIGAAELIAHLKGEISLDHAIEKAVIATRQYAKRQRSWFRKRMKDWQWVEMRDNS